MSLPELYYSSAQVKLGEIEAAKESGIEMYALMARAGQAVFSVLKSTYPSAKRLLICCGGGNNGGDGYIVAKLALEHHYQVTVWHVGDVATIGGDAKRAYLEYLAAGGVVSSATQELPNVDVVVDAILGTGLSGPVRSERLALILNINHSSFPVISIDIPSGLNADTGAVMGCAIHASHTVSFIGLKQGLVTGKARDYVGKMHFAGLDVEQVFERQTQAVVRAIPSNMLDSLRSPREKSAHKGDFGKALLVGGQLGMGGALLLASQACIRTGAGLTAALTYQGNVQASLTGYPEIMAGDWHDDALFEKRLHWASAIGIGPGLGCDAFAKKRLNQVQAMDTPKVLDADALTLLSLYPNIDHNRIITPHPGEAARLLNTTVQTIEADRYRAVQSLQKRYGGVCVLKGAGTLICAGDDVYVCLQGNPGMATGGMGDVLTGIITALLANKLPIEQAALVGVLLHSLAADKEAELRGENGLLASDLFAHLRQLIN